MNDHHEHSHPNSIFSGVYYIDADETDKITFTNPKFLPFTLDIQSTNFNQWNSKSKVPTPSNTVFIFPSSFGHRVEPTTNKNTRELVCLLILLLKVIYIWIMD